MTETKLMSSIHPSIQPVCSAFRPMRQNSFLLTAGSSSDSFMVSTGEHRFSWWTFIVKSHVFVLSPLVEPPPFSHPSTGRLYFASCSGHLTPCWQMSHPLFWLRLNPSLGVDRLNFPSSLTPVLLLRRPAEFES